MKPREEQHADDAWFVYSRRAGKFTATPANAKGRLAFGICLALIFLVGWTTSYWAYTLHPVLGFLAVAIVAVIGVLLILRLAIAKGRLE